jgi:hypothetical protein
VETTWVRSLGRREGRSAGINIGPRRKSPEAVLVEIGGFRFLNLRETYER